MRRIGEHRRISLEHISSEGRALLVNLRLDLLDLIGLALLLISRRLGGILLMRKEIRPDYNILIQICHLNLFLYIER